MKVKIRRRIVAKMPGFELDEKLLTEIFEIAEGNIIDNIMQQKQATGAAIKRNAPGTRRRKEKQGNTHPHLSLVDKEHRFIRGKKGSYRAQVFGKGSKTRMVIRPMFSKLNRAVQQKGYIGWFGISDEGRKAIRHAVRKWVNREVRKAIAKAQRQQALRG